MTNTTTESSAFEKGLEAAEKRQRIRARRLRRRLTLASRKVVDKDDQGAYIPTQSEIKRELAKIRSGWSDYEESRRNNYKPQPIELTIIIDSENVCARKRIPN